MPLTNRQQAFVDEYLIDLNASAASVRAGYKGPANVVGPRLLANAGIKQALAQKMQERQERAQTTADSVIRDIEAIKSDAMQKVEDKDGNPAMLNHTAALRACELLGKHFGMFGDKMAVTIESTPDDDLDSRIAELLVATSAAQTAHRGDMH